MDEIIEMKAKVFDILARQEALQKEYRLLEQEKQEIVSQIKKNVVTKKEK